jgi:hypothetical protein
MGRRSLALAALAATSAVSSATAAVVLAPTIFDRVSLAPGAVAAVTVACPPGYVAPSAGAVVPAPGTTLLASGPAGDRAFAFRFGNPRTNAVRRVAVAVACRKVRTSATVIKLRPVRRKPLVVPPGRQRSVALGCTAGFVPAGAGFDLDPAGQSRGFVGTELSVRRITAGLRRFSFVVRNGGKAPRSVAVSGNCVTVVSAPGAPRERLHVRVSTFDEPIAPGRHPVTRRCPRGWFSIAAGYALPTPLAAIEAAAVIRRGGKWWVANNAAGRIKIALQLACGRIALG